MDATRKKNEGRSIMPKNIFESEDFSEKFQSAIEEYNKAIDNDTEPSSAAQEFINFMFDSDLNEAFEYHTVLENMNDPETARKLQDIVFNSASLIS